MIAAIRTVYQRPIVAHGIWCGDTPVAVEADVLVDDGEGFLSEVCLVWSDETLAAFDALAVKPEEKLGAIEAIEKKFWSSNEFPRLASARPQALEEVA